MDRDFKDDAKKSMNNMEGKMERGKERAEKAYDNMKHDAKIKASEVKENVKNKADELENKWDEKMDKNG